MENNGGGTLFLTSTETAQPSIYDPPSEYQRVVLDTINIGHMEAMWNISNERVMMALAITMTDNPMAVNMSFQPLPIRPPCYSMGITIR